MSRQITGISHLSLSVGNRDDSVAWYGELLGFQPVATLDCDDYLETICMDSNGTILAFQQHLEGGAAYHPSRHGLDHLAFSVNSTAALDEWATFLDEHGVTWSPVADTPFGKVLCFRDPDGLQLELFAMAGT
ncbi:VOC family protein [Nocardia stercoris]|uniref:VOC family protein n=1 Tax=Nocardia stercoris TaxID=2483361 RepID=UPI001319C565|nr:VOC family protein [Nocardia stercoris]